jgi:hypothetical protein
MGNAERQGKGKMIRNHNKFCYHECIQDIRRINRREFELHQIVNNEINDKKIKDIAMEELRVIERNLFHIRAGHDRI